MEFVMENGKGNKWIKWTAKLRKHQKAWKEGELQVLEIKEADTIKQTELKEKKRVPQKNVKISRIQALQ